MVGIKPETSFLMDQYERLYARHEKRIAASLDRCTKALHHRPVDRPPVWQVSQTRLFPRHELFYDKEKNLLNNLAKNVLSMEPETDFVPFLDPFEGVTKIAEAFGCRVVIPENGDPAVAAPIIKKAEDVYSLKKPDPDNPVFLDVFDTIRTWQDLTGSIIPIGTTDPQSPLNVADLLWETNDFFISLYTHKKEVHYLLDMITEVFIDFYSRQLEIIDNRACPVHAFPLVSPNDGIAVSDDEMALLSPELYEEYGVPCNSRIGEHFGGIYLHSCGRYGDFLDAVTSIEQIRAVNGHLSPMEFQPEFIPKLMDKKVGLFIGISDKSVGWKQNSWGPGEEIDFYHSYYLPAVLSRTGGTGVVLAGYGGYFGYFHNPEHSGEGPIVDSRGHVVENNPFIDVSLDEKNRNFRAIIEAVTSLLEKIENGEDVCNNDAYRRYAVP